LLVAGIKLVKTIGVEHFLEPLGASQYDSDVIMDCSYSFGYWRSGSLSELSKKECETVS
jgi:hypothetical protein